jgi:hypothetical protein
MTDLLAWLLEPDAANPGVRFFTLTDLLDRPRDDAEVRAAQAAVMQSGPVPAILDAQQADGSWSPSGPGYAPKYRGTVWSVTFLAMLGADDRHPGVRAGGDYVLDHSRARSPYGGFSINATPSMTIHCLQGNLAAALIDLGFLGDPRLDEAIGWLARSITGNGIAPADDKAAAVHYYRSGNSGPGFLCSGNNHKACAWGAIKAMLALSKIPAPARPPAVEKAIAEGAGFLLSRDPAVADYPTPFDGKPSESWFRFGYPLGYVTDVLQNLEALTRLGFGLDPRLGGALDWLLTRRDRDGRWLMTYSYNGKMWADVETPGRPSKWVTLRALRVLKRAGRPF